MGAKRKTVELGPDQRWASCNKELHEGVARYRHIVTKGALTTRCGASASHAEVWQGNTTKPRCPQCVNAVLEAQRREFG